MRTFMIRTEPCLPVTIITTTTMIIIIQCNMSEPIVVPIIAPSYSSP